MVFMGWIQGRWVIALLFYLLLSQSFLFYSFNLFFVDLTSHLHASVRYILLVLEVNFVSFYREAEELAEVEAKLVGLVFTFMALYVCFIRVSTPHFFSSSLCYQDADWKTNTSSAKGQGKVIRMNNLV